MNADVDADLRERFRKLRDRDGAEAPAFDAVLRSATARPRRDTSARALAATGFVTACAIGLVVFFRAGAPVPAVDAARLPAWPHQTAVLLGRTSDPWQSVAWSGSPTSTLGQRTLTRTPEGK